MIHYCLSEGQLASKPKETSLQFVWIEENSKSTVACESVCAYALQPSESRGSHMHGGCFVRLTSLFHTCGLLNLQMRTVGVCLSDEMYVCLFSGSVALWFFVLVFVIVQFYSVSWVFSSSFFPVFIEFKFMFLFFFLIIVSHFMLYLVVKCFSCLIILLPLYD